MISFIHSGREVKIYRVSNSNKMVGIVSYMAVLLVYFTQNIIGKKVGSCHIDGQPGGIRINKFLTQLDNK